MQGIIEKNSVQDWAESVAQKIYEKELIVCERNFNKIPYVAIEGVFDDKSGEICWWTNGFWAGLLWQLYGYKNEKLFLEAAQKIEEKLDKNLLTASGMDHDSGFKWLLTSLANYRFTRSPQSKNRAVLAANDLAGRFNLAGNFIRAWNDEDGEKAGWAIIDCLMNIPLLYWASEELNDPRFALIAKAHATTAKNSFLRQDGSVCHIVVFDPNSGKRLHSLGGQGFAHGSCWTRGQGWALYGFTLSYLHTKDPEFLLAAEKAANYFLERIPSNGLIPIDFCQPKEGNEEDSSASAIASCGFLELYRVTKKEKYFLAALRLLKALEKYRCNFSSESDELLEGGSVAYHSEERNVPLVYGDYFFTEAILKSCEKETFLW